MTERKDRLLIIFTRNAELGKCKTRLAAVIGDQPALELYKFLLAHTVSVTRELKVARIVYYSEAVRQNDLWDPAIYSKEVQRGSDLGERMEQAFRNAFEAGYSKIIIIGSDLYDLSQEELEQAFTALENSDFVLGPASDGGYYLLGMKAPFPELFRNKQWGGHEVLKATLEDLEGRSVARLPVKNDIDRYEDIKDVPVFQPFIKHLKT